LTVESATERAIEAERIGKTRETTLKDKIEQIRILQETLDLMCQCSKLTKQLAVTLQELDEKQKMCVSLYGNILLGTIMILYRQIPIPQ
jgi:hypothetical protein